MNRIPYVDVAGKRYFYLDRGPDGAVPTVLFLHGSGGSGMHWVHQLEIAGPDVRVLAVDLPGHGHSEGCAFNRISFYREFVRQFAVRLALPRFYLAGHSMGGAIAMDYALAYPTDLAGLILLGTGAKLRVGPDILAAFEAGQVYPGLVSLLYGPGADSLLKEKSLREMEMVDSSIFFADFSACNDFDIRDLLSRIDVRTLVMVGSADRMTPPGFAVYLGQHLPRATVFTVPDAGHMLMLEDPETVNEALSTFLADAN